MNAEIITIGDEILIGHILNTNAALISKKLNEIGIFVNFQTTVGDELKKIISAFKIATKRSKVIIITGGLGPTHDDITRSALCQYFNSKLILDRNVLNNITELLKKRNVELTEVRKSQALIPDKAIALNNIYGTAPGMLFKNKKNIFVALPGVPYEMEFILEDSVIPYLKKINPNKIVLHKTLLTTGISESSLAEIIGNIENILLKNKNASLAFLPNPTGVKLRITIKNLNKISSKNILGKIEKNIRSKVNKYIIAVDNETPESLILKLMLKNKLSLSTAESCTGGMLSNRLTNISGSSNYFLNGFITYSNEAKTKILKIESKLIKKYGAVSLEVAKLMAKNARKITGSTHAISITGIAGPNSNSQNKLIGLVFIGYSDAIETIGFKFNFPDERIRFKERVTQQALVILLRKLLLIE